MRHERQPSGSCHSPVDSLNDQLPTLYSLQLLSESEKKMMSRLRKLVAIITDVCAIIQACSHHIICFLEVLRFVFFSQTNLLIVSVIYSENERFKKEVLVLPIEKIICLIIFASFFLLFHVKYSVLRLLWKHKKSIIQYFACKVHWKKQKHQRNSIVFFPKRQNIMSIYGSILARDIHFHL